MRLICPNCAAQYEIDEQVLPEKGRDVACSRCGQVWFQARPLPPEPAAFDPQERPALNRSLSDSVLSVLREEAARELRARDEELARAAADRSRFKAEAFAPSPKPDPAPEILPEIAAEVPPPAPKSPLADESQQIDWPATTITDDRIQDLPVSTALLPVAAQGSADPDAATQITASDRNQSAFEGDDPHDAARPNVLPNALTNTLPVPFAADPQLAADDEPVATLLFDDSPAPAPEIAPKGAAEGFASLPNDLPGDSLDPVAAVPYAPVQAPMPARDWEKLVEKRGGYGRGLGLSLGLAAALVGFYMIAPSLGDGGGFARTPLGNFAAEYRATIDHGRLWLSDALGLTGRASR